MPGSIVDEAIMRRTLDKMMETFGQWDMWGTDGPMIAMTAARLGEPELAIKALLMPVSVAAHLPQVLRAPDMTGAERTRAAWTLGRIRCARMAWMFIQAVTGKA